MQFRPLAVDLAEVQCRTRVPFRFGAVTLQQAPLLHLRVCVESVDGRRATGAAADLLVPKWFRKDPDRSAEQDQEDLRQSVRDAAQITLDDDTPRRVFDLWWRAYARMVDTLPDEAPDRLVRGFGCALLERALIDAACRLARKTFWSALHNDLFGIQLGRLHPELDGTAVPDVLPARPRTSFLVRHTVGMLDPLRDEDATDAPDDGLPRSLSGYLRQDGVRWLKVKVGAGLDQDRRRLLEIAGLCRELDADVSFTLDGNEQFGSLTQLAELLDAVAAEPLGASLLQRLRFVEQPLSRQDTLRSEANAGIERVTARAPLVLDEADVDLSAFPRALALGWRGCSVKNCKGVFRALTNRAWIARQAPDAFQTAEDLTNLPLLPLQQDLTTMSALDLEHVERNGHHYFHGLGHLPPTATEAALRVHADLYRKSAAGAELCIENGAIRADSLLGPGYGCDQEAIDELLEALEWRPAVDRT
jgi:hypothetical protein